MPEHPIGFVQSQADLAAWLGVHRNTVIAYLRGGMPGKDPETGLYSVPAAIGWMVEQVQLGGDGESEDAKKWLAAYRKEKAREARRRNDVEEGILVTLEDVRALHLATAAVFRRQAERVERRLGRKVGEAIQEMVGVVVTAWEGFGAIGG